MEGEKAMAGVVADAEVVQVPEEGSARGQERALPPSCSVRQRGGSKRTRALHESRSLSGEEYPEKKQ